MESRADYVTYAAAGRTGILFDMDGTLWDASAGVAAAWTEIVRRHPETGLSEVTQQKVQSVMGQTMTRIADILFPGLAPDKRTRIMKECTDNENDYLRVNGGVLYSGLEKTLRKLCVNESGNAGSGYPLYIESNCQSGYIEAFLDHYGFRKYFRDWLCFGDNGCGKAENIRLLAQQHQLHRYYYIGDIQADHDAAETADAVFIHAAYGFGSVKENVPELRAIEDLPDMIRKLESDFNRHS